MRYSTTAMMLAAMTISEAMAGPTHVHLHRKAHEKKDIDYATIDWAALDINWASAYEAGEAAKTAAAAGPAATSAPSVPTSAPAPATSSSETTTNTESDVAELFDGVVGASNSRTTFGGSSVTSGTAGDSYIGEYGVPYGANIIKVESTSGYDFTATFVNTQSKSITVNCWNKVGPDFEPLSGSALAPRNTTLTFALSPGSSQVVAFMDNTQFACAESCSETAASGAFATTWFEGNMLSTGSGYDVSAIMNANGNAYNMCITSKEAPDCISDMTQNMWLSPTEPVGGSDGSCYIAQSTATLTVTMGGPA